MQAPTESPPPPDAAASCAPTAIAADTASPSPGVPFALPQVPTYAQLMQADTTAIAADTAYARPQVPTYAQVMQVCRSCVVKLCIVSGLCESFRLFVAGIIASFSGLWWLWCCNIAQRPLLVGG